MTACDTPPDEARSRAARGRMPFRHKALLLAAFEILVVGFTQAELHPQRRGIVVEIPAHPDHRVT